MKKVGFIDYFLDEWHANNFPEWIKDVSGGEIVVGYAFAMQNSPLPGGRTTAEWCRDYGVEMCKTIEEVVEKSDCLIVLAPDNSELHEYLCQVALRSGKPCYIDKTFAPDGETAKRIFKIAEDSGTPCYSASALRYAAEYKSINKDKVTAISSWGPNGYDTYSIHQLEPIFMLMNSPARRIMYVPAENWYTLVIDFVNGKKATVTGYPLGSPFMMNIAGKETVKLVNVGSDYFHEFICDLVDFFRTGVEKVDHTITVEIMTVMAAGKRAAQKPNTWIEI